SAIARSATTCKARGNQYPAEISTSLITDSLCAWVSLTRTEEGDVSIGTSGQDRAYHQHLTAASHNWCSGSAASQGSPATSVVFTCPGNYPHDAQLDYFRINQPDADPSLLDGSRPGSAEA